MKKILAVFSCFIFIFFFAHFTYAQYSQYGQPTPSLSIVINKMVSVPTEQNINDPSNAQYVDNLSSTDPRFHPGEYIYFKLAVQNTSTISITNVNVYDYLPSYINPVSGPGTYDSNNRTISFHAGDFDAGQEKDYYLKAQVNNQDNLPSDKGLFCLVNKATASNDQVSDNDTAQFCVEKVVPKITSAPSAGPEYGFVLLIGELSFIGSGFILNRISHKYPVKNQVRIK